MSLLRLLVFFLQFWDSMGNRQTIDKAFLTMTLILVGVGVIIFSSASLGLLAREGIRVSGIAVNQIFGIVLGLGLMYIAMRIPYRFWSKYSLYILIASIVLTLAVFIPGLGFSHGGATRWLSLGPLTFQPAEFLKLGFVIYFATWLSGMWRKIGKVRYGVGMLIGLLLVVGAVLAIQPDIGTFLVIAATGVVMFMAAGGKWSHILGFGVLSGMGLGVLGLVMPYIRLRLLTFINPASDPLGAGYQIQQSLIAIGSGKIFGRGFGQSIQKFNFLPEPVSDSIFAVFSEEWGFIGALFLLTLFILFTLRALKIASRAPTLFSGLLVTGITTLIIVQVFINIGSMMGIFPLTGMPLLFVSQGGSAMMLLLLQVGIILGVSKYQKRERI